MTTQEILASLSQLEEELESIASARLLTEQTATAYKEVQEDIKVFFSEFQNVIDSLNNTSNALESEKSALTSDAKTTVDILKGQLDTLNEAFANRCDAIVLGLVNSSNKVADGFKTKVDSLTTNFELNNDTLKTRITELSTVQSTTSKVVESVATIKSDIATLQGQLTDSQKQQDATLESIANELISTRAKISTINEKIEETVDTLLNTLKQNVDSVSNKLDTIQAKQESLASAVEYIRTGISGLGDMIDINAKETNGRIDKILNVGKSTKTIVIVNIVICLIVLLLTFFK